jgi:hypothetical protein
MVNINVDKALKYSPSGNTARDIWCYDLDGNLLWEVEESPRYFTAWPKKFKKENPERKDFYEYVKYVKETDELIARTSAGYYKLDPETGKVSNFHYDGGR